MKKQELNNLKTNFKKHKKSIINSKWYEGWAHYIEKLIDMALAGQSEGSRYDEGYQEGHDQGYEEGLDRRYK